MAGADLHLAVLLTCHNRRARTLACLQSLDEQDVPAGVHVQVILVDAGSSDGTVEAVAACYPEVSILRGDGSLFWNGGMRTAFAEALRTGFDYYVWLNDDVVLYRHALATLLTTHNELRRAAQEPAIVVGSIQDPQSGRGTYGGLVCCSRWHPFKYELIEPGARPVPCGVMNGNLVLIPHSVAGLVGNLDAGFTHAIGDFDYAMRARRLGCTIWIAPGYAGAGTRNALAGSWEDTSLPLRRRWKLLRGPKGIPFKEWMRYARRYAGVLWPVYGSLPYVRVVVSSLVKK